MNKARWTTGDRRTDVFVVLLVIAGSITGWPGRSPISAKKRLTWPGRGDYGITTNWMAEEESKLRPSSTMAV